MVKEELQVEVLKEIARARAKVAVLVERFDKPEVLVSYQPERRVVSASMIKVPILLTALELVQQGEVKVDTQLYVSDANILSDSEVFEYGPGNYSLEELLVWMIINSDNTATNCLIDFLGMDRINEYCSRSSLHNTKLERRMLDFAAIKQGLNNYTSASDMRVLYKALYDKSILPPFLCDYGLAILKRQRHKQNAMRYIKDEVVVAHKTGGLDFLNHDAGIFYLEKAHYYFGAFVTDAPDNDYGKRMIGRLSRFVYEYYLHNSE